MALSSGFLYRCFIVTGLNQSNLVTGVYSEPVLSVCHKCTFELNAVAALLAQEVLGKVIGLGLFQANPLSLSVIAFVVVTITSVLINAENIFF